jgi:hypothetical protein
MSKIKFIYKSVPGYNPRYVTGVYGGLNPGQLLIANFFLERLPEEHEEVFDFYPDGSLGEKINGVNADTPIEVVRYIESGVVMNIDTAKSFRDWLTVQIDGIEKKENEDDALQRL